MVKEIYGLEFEPKELEKKLEVEKGLQIVEFKRLTNGKVYLGLDLCQSEEKDEKPKKDEKSKKGRKTSISDKDFKKAYDSCGGNVKKICEMIDMKYPTAWKKANDIKKQQAQDQVNNDLESIPDLD